MSAAIFHPSGEAFDALIEGGSPVLVDFRADWCMPCHMLAPVIKRKQYQKLDAMLKK